MSTPHQLSSGDQDELVCAVCRNIMSDPRVLSCQHVFCLKCIHSSCDGAGAPTGSQVSVKCPYNCGETEIGDLRNLPKNTIITNLCHSARKARFEEGGNVEDRLCDYCCDEDRKDTALCKRCAGVLCPQCEQGPEHMHLCGSDDVWYPFYYGWMAAEGELKRVLRRHGIFSTPRVRRVQRVFAPCCFPSVMMEACSARGKTVVCGPQMAFLADVLGPSFTRTVESGGFRPIQCRQLDIYFKLQEVRSRQLQLLRIVKDLVTCSQAAEPLRKNSAEIEDPVYWDGGFANDCCVLVEMMLTLVKQVYLPVKKKLHVLGSLQGFRTTAASYSSMRRSAVDRARRHAARQLQMAGRLEAFNTKQDAEERKLLQEIDTVVHDLLARQHDAYEAWRRSAAPVSLSPQSCSQGSFSFRFSASWAGTYRCTVKAAAAGTLRVADQVLPFAPGTPVSLSLPRGSNVLVVTSPCNDTRIELVPTLPQFPCPQPQQQQQHEEALAILGYCHKLQIDILQSLEAAYAQACKTYWGDDHEPSRKELDIQKERGELLNLLRNIQQVRIFHRQYFYCTVSGQAPVGKLEVPPFPVAVPRPSPRSTINTTPILLKALQPKLHEFREEYEGSTWQKEQMEYVLLQTLELLHREQIVQLQEAVQEARELLMLHIQPGSVTALLEHLGPRTDPQQACNARSDVHDLQIVQVLWSTSFDHSPPPPPPPAREAHPSNPLLAMQSDDTKDSPRSDSSSSSTAPPARAELASPMSGGLQLGERLTRGVVKGLMNYIRLVVQQREKLEESIVGLDGAGKQAVGAAAVKLELHLKVVEYLRKLLKVAQTCRGNTRKFQLLSQVVAVLQKLDAPGTLTADTPGSDRDMQQVIMAMRSLYETTCSPAMVLSLPPHDASDPLISWFAKHDAMRCIGLMESCFAGAPGYWDVPRTPFTPTPQQRRDAAARAESSAKANTLLSSLACCVAMQLGCPQSATRLSFTTVPGSADYTTHVPFYKGEYTADDDPRSRPMQFIVNGQTGEVVVEYCYTSLTASLCSLARSVLTCPATWLLLNGALYYCLSRRGREPKHGKGHTAVP